ncbi:hypothetical protein BDZ91DRAFT_853725 [Kalaharituber pfeilii]|nr:hypothetical protein BDZ91DRAFT_853725 [Kalaharituber pfeilii]
MLANQRPNSTHKIDNDRQRSTYRSTYYNTSIAATRPIYSLTHPSSPGTTTPKEGIVGHGIALRKDLRNVRRWMEADNKDIGKITGIRWLRNKTILREEGKKTSSVVVYLEDTTEVDRVRLGRRLLRACRYESDRGRK